MKQLSKILLILCATLGLVHCSCSPTHLRQAAVDFAGTTDVWLITGTRAQYIVRKMDGSVWEVLLWTETGKVQAATQLFAATPQPAERPLKPE